MSTKTTKHPSPAPSKARKTLPRKKFTFLKGYGELAPDPWGLES